MRSLVEFLKLFHVDSFMRLLVDDIISDLRVKLEETKGIRNKVLLKDALKALQEFKASNEKRF